LSLALEFQRTVGHSGETGSQNCARLWAWSTGVGSRAGVAFVRVQLFRRIGEGCGLTTLRADDGDRMGD
jgi:hypothetical protein